MDELPVDHIDIEKNKKKVLELICGWIQANEGDDRMRLFAYAICRQLFDFQLLSGAELEILLPLAHEFEDPSVFTAIATELKSSIAKWRNAIESKAPLGLYSLSWERMLIAYHLQKEPRPSAQTSTIMNEMRMAASRMDSRFYHWIMNNRQSVTFDMIVQYLNLPSTEPSHAKNQYRRLVVIDILNAFQDQQKVRPTKVRVIKEFEAKADFGDLYAALLNKPHVQIHLKTLEQLKRHCSTPSLMAQYVKLLQKSVPPANAIHLILPVNELSVETCLEIAAEVSDCPIATLDSIAAIARLVLGTFSPQMLILTAGIIPFNCIFNGTLPMILCEEDTALFYFFANWRIDFDFHRIEWPHISLRAATQIWPDFFNQNFSIDFQFPLRPESILASLDTRGLSLPFEAWIDRPEVPPRRGTFTNLASIRPRHAIVDILDLGNHSLTFLRNTLRLALNLKKSIID
jgi:hypothetical protein